MRLTWTRTTAAGRGLCRGRRQFSAKCLGKLNEVASSEGRTVIFVTHDMAAICPCAGGWFYYEDGRLKAIGDTEQVVDQYLKSVSEVEDVSIEKRGDIDKNCDGDVEGKPPFKLIIWNRGNLYDLPVEIGIKVGYRSDKPVRNLIFSFLLKILIPARHLQSSIAIIQRHTREHLPK